MPLYGIAGAGGFAREVMPVALEMLSAAQPGQTPELVFIVEHIDAPTINGHRVVTTEEFLASGREKYFNIAIASSQARARIAQQLLDGGASPFSIRALNSVRLSHNSIGEGDILCSFTTITSNATIGRFFHANLYAYVAHDCRIGDFVTLGPNAHCNGRVVIEDGAYIGAGAMIKQGTDERPIVIGRGAVVGMGAVVTKSVAPFTTVVGNPAVLLKKKEG